MAVAAVANQRYYDTIYQERYMGLPGDNADGFLQGSPVNFAHKVEGNLLIVHGTGDDNCRYQASEALVKAFVCGIQKTRFDGSHVAFLRLRELIAPVSSNYRRYETRPANEARILVITSTTRRD